MSVVVDVGSSEFNSARYGEPQGISPGSLVRINKVLGLIGRGHRVLDLGCWDGSIAAMIRDRGNTVCAMENSGPAADLAEAKGIAVFRADIGSPEWPDFGGPFDVVFAGEIIEHVFDTDRFLQQVRNVLSVDGALVLTTPNIAAFGRRLMLLAGLSPHVETTARDYDAGHIRYFTRKTLRRLLDENGFAVETVVSDVVNFSASGRLHSAALASLLPTLGTSLIAKARIRQG